jgi:DNA repair protein RadC
MSRPILTQLSFVRQEISESDRALRESFLSEPPAERLIQHGATALTTHDLVSLVLGTSKDPTIAARLLVELKCISKARALSVHELTHVVPGITVDRACRLLAALELSERVRAPRENQTVIKTPADAAEVVRDMASLEQEQMRVILLDTKNKVIQIATVYQGSVNTTLIRVGELMKVAVRLNATSIVICHNHPSGDPTPSDADIAVTVEVNKAAKLLDIECLDHIVIGEAGRFVSLKERRLGF